MASASSINTVSAAGNKNYISGLASGMDTDSIVESLLMGTQTKIDKQTGLKQHLEWKQETYRDLIGKINTFGDKYFSYYGSGQTNLMSPTTFKTMTGLSSNSAIKISSVSSNAVSSMKVDAVKQLATACTVKTAGTVTGAPVGKTADFSQTAFKEGETYSFSTTLDGVSRTISFTGGADKEETLKNINQALYRNFGTSVGMKVDWNKEDSGVELETGTMKLVQLDKNGNTTDIPVNSSRRVIIETAGSNNDAKSTIKNMGFEGGFSNKLDYGTSLKDMNFATPLQGNRYEFEINGVTIKGLTGDSTLSDVISAINSSDAGVKVSYSSAADRFIMESSSTGEISNITMSQKYGNLLTTMFGVEATGLQSSLFSEDISSTETLDFDSLLSDLNSGKGQFLMLQVDGKDFKVSLDGRTGSESYKDAKSVLDAINSKLNKEFGSGKIEFSLNDSGDKVILRSSAYEVGFSKQNLEVGIGKNLGFKYDPDKEINNTLSGADDDLEKAKLSGTIEIYIGGAGSIPKTIALDATMKLDALAQELSDITGATVTYEGGRFNITGLSGDIEIKGIPAPGVANPDGTTGEEGANPVEILFGKKSIHNIPNTNTLTSNEVSNTSILKGKITITQEGGSPQEINVGNLGIPRSFSDLADEIQNKAGAGVSVSYTADHKIQIQGISKGFTIEGVDDDGIALVNSLFGQDEMTFSSQMTASVTSGQNAILTVDGTDIERNTNTFELDGITMEITSTYDASNGPISLTTSRDTDKIVDSLKSFVEDYNNLIEELNKQLTETANYKKYAPLTDAQKKEMSDKEIELWEEKSKQGLLHNDSNISSFLGDMRMVLYSSVEGAGLSLYDIGIETSDNWRDNGKLVIDEDALRSAVATNPDAIATLFTDRDQGLGVKMQNAIKAAANVSSGSPGSMVRYAGTKDVLTTSNTLYEEMKHITETLSNLNTKYQLEKTRYWKQFTAMEQAISNMNSQSSWLTQQFSS